MPVPELGAAVPTIDVTGLVGLLDSGDDTVVIDLARSIDYREGHIPGALWGVRTRLDGARAAACRREACGDHLARRRGRAAGGGRGEGL